MLSWDEIIIGNLVEIRRVSSLYWETRKVAQACHDSIK